MTLAGRAAPLQRSRSSVPICLGMWHRDVGDVASVTFPCGYTLGADNDTISLYHGAADTSLVLATGSVRQLPWWLDEKDISWR